MDSGVMEADVNLTDTIRQDLEPEPERNVGRGTSSIVSLDLPGLAGSRSETPFGDALQLYGSRPGSPTLSMFVDQPLRSMTPVQRAAPSSTPRATPTPPPHQMSPLPRSTPPPRTPTPGGMRTTPPPRTPPPRTTPPVR